MTEADLLEILSMHRNEAGSHVMNFFAVMSGYMATAYFIGQKLSRFQVIALTILYTGIVPMPLLAGVQTAEIIVALHSKYGALIPQTTMDQFVSIAPATIGGTIVLSWLVSLVLMYRIRGSREDTAAS
ncbi:MAG: hypothetical protein HOK61_13050 [Alphaproteobacteria bacterium]|jgi:hypothetical protein|nr:hypothetical protein [Alphaproteobacteria bacterium]